MSKAKKKKSMSTTNFVADQIRAIVQYKHGIDITQEVEQALVFAGNVSSEEELTEDTPVTPNNNPPRFSSSNFEEFGGLSKSKSFRIYKTETTTQRGEGGYLPRGTVAAMCEKLNITTSRYGQCRKAMQEDGLLTVRRKN